MLPRPTIKIEVSAYFDYYTAMSKPSRITSDVSVSYAGRRKEDVPAIRVRRLSTGRCETANWTEWMATDMTLLGKVVAKGCSRAGTRRALMRAAADASGKGILARLQIFGAQISEAFRTFDHPEFEALARHPSDVVRQWAAYAVNHDPDRMPPKERLRLTLPFAGDTNMTVRECAWMAFRPYVMADVDRMLKLLPAASADDRVRRFAVEVCRPRSVWGRHIDELKREPERALFLLEKVKRDNSRYVRLAVGNWLNDASKSRPDWVQAVATAWTVGADRNTASILKRGLRTMDRTGTVIRTVERERRLVGPSPLRSGTC